MKKILRYSIILAVLLIVLSANEINEKINFSEQYHSLSTNANQDIVRPLTKHLLPDVCACTVSATNDNCTDAIVVVVGAGSSFYTTCNATVAESTDCGYGTITQTVWFKFVATATTLMVGIDQNPATGGTNGCYMSSAVWKGGPGGTCPTSSCDVIDCQSALNGTDRQEYILKNLTIGNTYYIQVMYTGGGLCGSNASFALWVGTTFPTWPTNPASLSRCDSVSGTAYVFGHTPTITEVVDSCTHYPFPLNADSVNKVFKACYSFLTRDFNAIAIQNVISSTCSPGNVAWLDWEIWNSSCTSMIACGKLPNMNVNLPQCYMSGILCLRYELINCTYYWAAPYISAVTSGCGLPIELLDFKVVIEDGTHVQVSWSTASEINNDVFIVERSIDGIHFIALTYVKGQGTTNSIHTYEIFDSNPLPGVSYYRLLQKDYDGKISISAMDRIRINGYSNLIYENGIFHLKVHEKGIVRMYNLLGECVDIKYADGGNISLGEFLPSGLYIIEYISETGTVLKMKCIK